MNHIIHLQDNKDKKSRNRNDIKGMAGKRNVAVALFWSNMGKIMRNGFRICVFCFCLSLIHLIWYMRARVRTHILSRVVFVSMPFHFYVHTRIILLCFSFSSSFFFSFCFGLSLPLWFTWVYLCINYSPFIHTIIKTKWKRHRCGRRCFAS